MCWQIYQRHWAYSSRAHRLSLRNRSYAKTFCVECIDICVINSDFLKNKWIAFYFRSRECTLWQFAGNNVFLFPSFPGKLSAPAELRSAYWEEEKEDASRIEYSQVEFEFLQGTDHAFIIIAFLREPSMTPSTCCSSVSVCGMNERMGGCSEVVSPWSLLPSQGWRQQHQWFHEASFTWEYGPEQKVSTERTQRANHATAVQELLAECNPKDFV